MSGFAAVWLFIQAGVFCWVIGFLLGCLGQALWELWEELRP